METCPDCKELVIQNGLNIHNPSSTSLFRTQLRLVYLDPNHVSSQVVQQFLMISRNLFISSHENAKDWIPFRQSCFGLKCMGIMKDLGSDSSASYNE